MWKTLHSICSNDFQIKFTHPLRLGIKALVPAISRAARQRNKTLYEHSFAVLGPRLWNTLPKDLTVISCQQKFKSISFRVMSSLYRTFHLIEDIPAPTTTRYLTENKAVALQSGWLATTR